MNLLILCFVLSQVIIGTISGEDINESSHLLVRNKRVLNFEPGEDRLAYPGQFPYVVNIELLNRTHCVGSIISILTVITSASCASAPVAEYKIISDSIYTNRGRAHHVIQKNIRLGHHVRARASDGIALLRVDSHFINTGVIPLHSGPIRTGAYATVTGWGCYYESFLRGTEYPNILRSITVPIMSYQECVNAYRGVVEVNNKDICVYDPHKHCGNTDSGAPLIISGKLAGIYIRRAVIPGQRDPEIFVDLQNDHYSHWIEANVVHTHRH